MDGLCEAGVGAARVTVFPLPAQHDRRHLEPSDHREAPVPHHKGWYNRLRELGFERVHQLLCLSVIERQDTFLIVAVDAYTVGNNTVQSAGLVVVLGCETLLEPVVQVDAPGRSGFSQLIELPQTPQSHSCRERFALLIETHLPVVLPGVNQRVSEYCVGLCSESVSARPGRRRSLWGHQG